MADDSEWVIVFYVDEKGYSPIQEFLQSLDIKTQARFAWSIEQLRIRNVRAKEPLVRHLDEKLWELREESSTNIYRLLYFFFSARRIVFVHGFQKKTQKTPRHEIEIALKRLDSFTKQQRNQT
jgi:phage-related protein